jgi:hypothetical protein
MKGLSGSTYLKVGPRACALTAFNERTSEIVTLYGKPENIQALYETLNCMMAEEGNCTA